LEDEVQLVTVTTEDKMIPPDAQRAMARRAGAEVVEVNRVPDAVLGRIQPFEDSEVVVPRDLCKHCLHN
jgi:hypothetical protein